MRSCGQIQASTATSVQMAFQSMSPALTCLWSPELMFSKKPPPLSQTSLQALTLPWEHCLASDLSSKFHQLSLNIIHYGAEELGQQWSAQRIRVQFPLPISGHTTSWNFRSRRSDILFWSLGAPTQSVNTQTKTYTRVNCCLDNTLSSPMLLSLTFSTACLLFLSDSPCLLQPLITLI